jgi:ferredoxin
LEAFGVNACVGCGRCISLCPVNIDIREVLTSL